MARKSYTKTLPPSDLRRARRLAAETAKPYATGEKREPYYKPSLIRTLGRYKAPAIAAKAIRDEVLLNTGALLSGQSGSGTGARENRTNRKISPTRIRARVHGSKGWKTTRKFDRDARGRFT